MFARISVCILLLVAFVTPALAADPIPEEKDILATLAKGHPRLILTRQRLGEIQDMKATPGFLKALDALEARGQKMLKADPIRYELIGPRLLSQSKKCLDEVTTCALLYRLKGDKAYADRAILEMTTAAEFKDWNPSHFLDTAEMTCALGLGYDWLYDTLTDAQRKTIREAIVSHGLRPGEQAYTGKASFGWWTKATHNWSQVCNGGLAVGALAIADEEPQLAAFTVHEGLKAVQGAFAHWDADGGWDEGPGYWGYTTSYTAYYLSALQTALGTMEGLDKTPGLDNAGLFRMHFIGPTGKTFNFADAGDNAGSPPQMFFLARLYNRPEYAWHHRQERVDSPLDVIWYDSAGEGPKATKLPPAKVFHGTDVVFLRSAWEDPQAWWIGAKGGNNAANHSHLDLGTFVLEAAGHRWFVDLGSDDYNLPGYFGGERWTYYRLKTEGHNTLLIDQANQPPKAQASVLAFAAADGPSAVIDLSPAYPMARRAWRGVRLLQDAAGAATGVLLQDEIQADKPVELVSRLHTPAEVTIAEKGRSATLKLADQTLRVELLGDPAAQLTAAPVKIELPQKELKGITCLSVRFPDKVSKAAITLLFSTGQHPEPTNTPLAQWPGMNKASQGVGNPER